MTTETWVLIVWSIGLIGALPPTLVILKEVRLILGTLSDIRVLAERTAAAAQGVARHVEPIPGLAATLGEPEAMMRASHRVSAASSALADAVGDTLGPSGLERLGSWLARWITGGR
jgi:hypothetical protein